MEKPEFINLSKDQIRRILEYRIQQAIQDQSLPLIDKMRPYQELCNYESMWIEQEILKNQANLK